MFAAVIVSQTLFGTTLYTYTALPVKLMTIWAGPLAGVESCQVWLRISKRSRTAGVQCEVVQLSVSEGLPACHAPVVPGGSSGRYCGTAPVVGSPKVSSTVTFTKSEAVVVRNKEREITTGKTAA